ncbi:MAG: PHP domain-containing protein [Candidatus Wallbacteria bacterium]|nr:PHP domain-containing protein [Candidatus Wallbacteria bacterium]
MEIVADLHLHTNCSDGLLSPEKMVNMAFEFGLSACSITDHDTVDGLESAIEKGRKIGVEVIPGIELNTDGPGGEVHILGYYIPHQDPVFLEELKILKQARVVRMKKMLENMKKIGITVYLEEILHEAGNAPPGRPHLARVLVKNGFSFSFEDAFRRYLEKGKPGYEPHFHKLTPKTAIQLIKRFNGLAVIAHPFTSSYGEAEIKGLLPYGLDGIEVFHSKHNSMTEKEYFLITDKYHLLATGGSDCHGEQTVCGLLVGKYGLTAEHFNNFKSKARC